MEAKIADLENKLPHTFRDKRRAAKALNTYRCAVFLNNAMLPLENNSKHAVYGDTVATRYLCHLWLETGLSTGDWTVVRSMLNNENLAAVGFRHELQRCVHLNPGTPHVSTSTMATTLEAILAAIYMDGGEPALAHVMGFLGLVHPLVRQVRLESASDATLEG